MCARDHLPKIVNVASNKRRERIFHTSRYQTPRNYPYGGVGGKFDVERVNNALEQEWNLYIQELRD